MPVYSSCVAAKPEPSNDGPVFLGRRATNAVRGQDEEMTGTLSTLKRFVIVMLFVLSGLVAAANRPAAASMNPPLVPLMLVGVPGTHSVYVVSTSNLFESSHPSACGFSCYLLQRTTDTGSHFKVLNLPRTSYLSDSLTGTLDQLVFANNLDGYAVMGAGAPRSLYVTLDGGGSWHRENITSGTEILQLVATTSHVFAVVARCSNNTTPCTDFRLATSPLAGDHWTISPLANWPVGMGVGLGAFGSTIWLTQQTHTTVKVLTSHNLGATFTEGSVPRLDSVYACYMTATSDTSLWARCPTGMESSFFYSRTSGITWNTIPIHFNNTAGGYFAPVSSSLAFLVLGRQGSVNAKNVIRISNQGRSLTPVGNLPCNIVNGLVFTDASHGLAACDERNSFASTILLKTSDGGASWSSATSFYTPV